MASWVCGAQRAVRQVADPLDGIIVHEPDYA